MSLPRHKMTSPNWKEGRKDQGRGARQDMKQAMKQTILEMPLMWIKGISRIVCFMTHTDRRRESVADYATVAEHSGTSCANTLQRAWSCSVMVAQLSAVTLGRRRQYCTCAHAWGHYAATATCVVPLHDTLKLTPVALSVRPSTCP